MVTALPKLKPTTRDTITKLDARIYRATGTRPIWQNIFAQQNKTGRVPQLNLVMADNQLQPHIHDGVITVIHKRKRIRFHIFIKNHTRMRLNKTIQKKWKGAVSWKGDIAIMRKGRKQELVNLSRRDVHLADFAVKGFLQKVNQKPKFYIPKKLVVVKP